MLISHRELKVESVPDGKVQGGAMSTIAPNVTITALVQYGLRWPNGRVNGLLV